jgi:homoserine kinase type II
MFRDNVFFEGSTISAIIDWESASDHALLYDLAVVLLAWCYSDGIDWSLARALVDSYADERPLRPVERTAFANVAGLAAVRFAVTRITDFHLRGDSRKDFQRFLDRLSVLEEIDPTSLEERLF